MMPNIIAKQQQISESDPCNTFKPVPDVGRRSVHYVPSQNEPYLNDYYRFRTKGWYGTEGYDMVMDAPQRGQTACGTLTPIYLQLNGSLPSNIGDIITGTACIVDWFTDCLMTFNIKIKHCKEELNIYELKRTDVVNSGYCFNRSEIVDNIAPAPDFNPTSIKVDVDLFWDVPTQVGAGQIEVRMPMLLFICSIDPMPDGLLYLVYWFVNSELKMSKGPVQKTEITKVAITEKELADIGIKTLGFTIKCGLRAFADINGLPGNMTTSRGFFAGFKVEDSRVIIERGEDKTINIESTVPLGCPYAVGTDQPTCDVAIELYHSTVDIDTCDGGLSVVGDARQCKISLNGTKFNNNTSGQREDRTKIYNWKIAQTDNADYKLVKKHFIVKLRVTIGVPQHRIWTGYKLDDIHILVKDNTSKWQSRICKAECDPHMLTFDGSRYEMQTAGVFTLYRHTSSPAEVQIRTELCSFGVKYAHCPCGVYIRGGSNIFIVSTCANYPYIDFLGTSCDQALQVYRKGDKIYKIILPTGTAVTVTLSDGWELTVYVDAAPRDTTQVEGLCGDLNGNATDDFQVNGTDFGNITICGGNLKCRNDFVNLYEVTEEHKYFPPTEKNRNFLDNLEMLTILHAQCVCKICADRVENQCNSKVYVKCPEHDEKDMSCHIKQMKRRRRKRQIPNIHMNLEQHLKKISKALKRKQGSSTHAPITIEEAKSICQAKFSSAGSYQFCKANVAGIENSREIENCIFDLNMTANKAWAQDALNSVTHLCIRAADKNSTLRKTVHRRPSIAAVIKEITCQNECSGNGICVNGACQCRDTFGGSDCSFEVHKSPDVYVDVGVDICDTSTTDCDFIQIFGGSFIDSENLTCSITETKIDIDGNVIDNTTEFVIGDARSPFEVRCSLTKFAQRNASTFVRRYSFNIANDGKLYGPTEKIIYVADTSCQQHTDGTYIFQLQDSYCFINGQCWSAGEHNENDIQQICIPQNNTFGWTNVSGTDYSNRTQNVTSTSTLGPDTDEEPQRKWTIIGVVIGVTVIAVVIGIFIFCRKRLVYNGTTGHHTDNREDMPTDPPYDKIIRDHQEHPYDSLPLQKRM